MGEASMIIRAKRIVTVSDLGTIEDGAMVISAGRIERLGPWEEVRRLYPDLGVESFPHDLITPSLVDCHSHLLEFASSALYPVKGRAQWMAGQSLILEALLSGITALGEQICGHPETIYRLADYEKLVADLPLDCVFSTNTISIGLPELAYYSAVTGRRRLSEGERMDLDLMAALADYSDYPGEHLFINATPANFTPDLVPRSGEILFELDELRRIVAVFHERGKEIGVHVGGRAGIDLALEAGVDVLHHAHDIAPDQIERARELGVRIVATPLGGTHLEPNSPDNILALVEGGIETSLATDAYLPPYPGADWLDFEDDSLRGSRDFLTLAAPAMRKLHSRSYDENDILALITLNPAKLLGRQDRYGQLVEGKEANFLVLPGLPGIDFTDVEEIRAVYVRGRKLIDRVGT